MKQVKIFTGLLELPFSKKPIILTNYHPERPRAFGLRRTNIAYARNLNLAKIK